MNGWKPWVCLAMMGCVNKRRNGPLRRRSDHLHHRGYGRPGYNHQNQTALDTDLNYPNALWDADDRLLINDSRNYLIRRMDGDILTTVVGKVSNIPRRVRR